MSDETELERWLRETWAEYQSDGYTSYGKLNLVACMGEKGGQILALIEQLRAENEQLRLNKDRQSEES